MRFIEQDLEEIIFNADPSLLEERGLYMHHTKLFRQLKIGNYGIADLVGFDKCLRCPQTNEIVRDNSITIYELKKDAINLDALMQGLKYLKGIQSYLDKRGCDYIIHLVLIGQNIDLTTNISFIPDTFKTCNGDIDFFTYSYELDGLFFKQISGYKLINEGFNL